MSMEQCEAAMDRAISIPDEYCDEIEMVQEAFALGCLMSRPVYDMFFLVLARRNNGSLLTMDARLKKNRSKSFHSCCITHLKKSIACTSPAAAGPKSQPSVKEEPLPEENGTGNQKNG